MRVAYLRDNCWVRFRFVGNGRRKDAVFHRRDQVRAAQVQPVPLGAGIGRHPGRLFALGLPRIYDLESHP